jgi:hypothetical protein
MNIDHLDIYDDSLRGNIRSMEEHSRTNTQRMSTNESLNYPNKGLAPYKMSNESPSIQSRQLNSQQGSQQRTGYNNTGPNGVGSNNKQTLGNFSNPANSNGNNYGQQRGTPKAACRWS